MSFRIPTLAAASALLLSAGAPAATLQGVFTADDFATVYLSTDLVPDAGEMVVDKLTTWQTVDSFSSVALAPGQDLFLLISVRNSLGGMAMFIGDFTISGDGFSFANGATALSTDTAHWSANTAGFGAPMAAPFEVGVNGASPWGLVPGVSADARFLWGTSQFDPGGETFFVTRITAAVPEPGTWALWCAGLGLMGGLARRRD